VCYSGSGDSIKNAGTVYFKSVSEVIHGYGVVSITAHKNIFLLDLEELNSVDEAETYKGSEIFIKKETLDREESSYFWYEILGLDVYLDTGEYVGSISRIIPAEGNDIYLIKKGKKEAYIPAIHEVVKEIDLRNGKMTISPMEGLLDLNED